MPVEFLFIVKLNGKTMKISKSNLPENKNTFDFALVMVQVVLSVEVSGVWLSFMLFWHLDKALAWA